MRKGYVPVLLDVLQSLLHLLDGGILISGAENCLGYQTTREKSGRDTPEPHKGSLDPFAIYEVGVIVFSSAGVFTVGYRLDCEDRAISQELTFFAFLSL